MAASAAVIAGLRCAPDTTATVWIRKKSANTCTRPITLQSMNGCTAGAVGVACTGAVANSDTASVMKRASANVPMNSATYAAGPRAGITSVTVAAAASSAISSPRVRSSSGSLASLASKVPPYAIARVAVPRQVRIPSSAVRRALLPLAALLTLAFAGCGGGGEPGSPRPVTLVLDFTPNAAHAGIYAAVAKHRDRQHNVELTIRQPTATSDSLKLLAIGRADMAVADIHDLGLARERGEDLVGVGALVQRPLASVIAGPKVTRPRQLEGKRVGVTGVPSDDAVLRAVVQGDGGDPKRVRTIPIGFTAVPSLIEGKVAAATAFWNVEGVVLKRRGVATHEFRVDAFGAPHYPELVLVARRETVEKDPGLVRETLAALADGPRDALPDKPAAVKRIAAAAQARPDLIAAELDAIAPALSPPIRLDPKVLAGWAAFDARLGILKRAPAVDQAFDTTLAP